MRRLGLAVCVCLAAGCADSPTEVPFTGSPQFNHTTPAEAPSEINVNNYRAVFASSGLTTFYMGKGAIFNGGISYGTDGSNVHFVNTANGQFDIATTGYPVQIAQPGALSDHYSSTIMAEQPSQALGPKNPLGILTVRETFAFTDPADDDYIIVKYSLTNTTSSPISGLNVGYLADPDVFDQLVTAASPTTNVAYFDGATQSARVRAIATGQTQHAIISLSQPVGSYRSWVNGNTVFPNRDPQTNDEWFAMMSSGIFSAQVGPADIRQYVGTIPTVLAPGETRVYSFALVGGQGDAQIASNIAAARVKAATLTAPVPAAAAIVNIHPGTVLWTARITFASPEQAAQFDADHATCGGAEVTASARVGSYVDVAFGALELDSRRKSGAAMHCAGMLTNGEYFAGTDYPTFTENSIPVTRLTTNTVSDFGATWSPDGSRIAFASGRNGGGIFVMDPTVGDASTTQLIVASGAQQPSWSSTGKIAFSLGNSIFVMPETGGAATLLKPNGTDPRYSPDGSRIMFRRGNLLMLMNADGTGEQQIGGSSTVPELYGEWTSNNTIIFTHIEPTFERIYSMTIGDPASATALTPIEPTTFRFADLAPDANTLVFTSGPNLVFQDMQSGLHTIAFPSVNIAASTLPTQANVEYSPDGTKILYTGGSNTTSEILLMNLPQPATPAERAQALVGSVQSLVADGLISAADAASLSDKLNIVAQKIAAGDFNPAINNVSAFINKVNALVNSRRLSTISGQQLTSEADLLITQLEKLQ